MLVERSTLQRECRRRNVGQSRQEREFGSTASTGFSADSRVISTADEMMREILTMVR